MDAWLWGLLTVLYICLLIWLGLATLRNGRGWMFFFGLFFPLLWIFGAFSGPREGTALSSPFIEPGN